MLKALFFPFRITPILTTIVLAIDIIGMLLAPLNVLITSFFIDSVLNVFNTNASIHNVVLSLVMMAAIHLYGYLANPIRKMLNKKREQKNWIEIHHELMATYAGLEIKHIEDSNTMDLIIRVWSNAPEIALVEIWEDFKNFMIQVGVIISYLLIILTHAPLAGVVIIIASIPVIMFARKCGVENYTTDKILTQKDREVGELRSYLRDKRYVSERNLFKYSTYINDKYYKTSTHTNAERLKIHKKNLISKNISETLLTILGAFILCLLFPAVKKGDVSVGMFISLIGVVFSAINSVTWGLSTYFEAFAVDAEYITDFNKYLELSKDTGSLEPMSLEAPKFEKLEFKNVTFVYPGTSKVILNNLSFMIEHGKRYAIVGINGSGKTTITKLILRQYNDYEGEILLNGVSLKEWPLEVIKNMFTAVFQDYAKYDISLEDNINIGACFRGTENEIDEAIRAVNLEQFVGTLKNGKRTLLGKIYEDGIDLSEGQWQRVAIARAIISPAQLKILDEPTASLDPLAEKEVYDHFDMISKGSATIFISHRLGAAKLADKIYVLNDGRIIENGSHAELIERKGLYAKMFEIQQGWYI